jgi:PST family polysaccharide transporter
MMSSLPGEENLSSIYPSAPKARSGIRGTLLSQSIRIIFSLVSLPIIARQLTPLDYGAFALLFLVITFLDNVRDFGITTAAMGARHFDEKIRSNIFWISLISGLFVFASGFLSSGVILRFFELEEYDLELKCLLLVLLFNGASSTYVLNLRRILSFKRIISIEIIGSSISAIAAIVSALSGLGIWALLIQNLTLSLVILVLSVMYSDWKPISPSRNSGLKTLYANGCFLLAIQYLNLLPQQLPTFVLGKSGEIIDAGNFDRGRQLQNIIHNYFNIPFRQIGIPIVRASYHSGGGLEDSIHKVHRMTLHILFPIYVLIFCQSETIVQILYGDKYTAVTPILRVLIIAAMIQTSDYIRMWILVILNQGKNSLKRSIVSFFIYAFCIFPMASSGVLHVAGGYLLASFVTMILGFWYFRKIEDLNVINLFSISLKFLSVYVSLALVLLLIQQHLMFHLPNLFVFCFELIIIIATVLIHLMYSKFFHEFSNVLKKVFSKG